MKKSLPILIVTGAFAYFSFVARPAKTGASAAERVVAKTEVMDAAPQPAVVTEAIPAEVAKPAEAEAPVVTAKPVTAAAKPVAPSVKKPAVAAKPAKKKATVAKVSAKPATAPASAEVAQKDPRAEKTLNEMSKKYQAMKAYSASFTQNLENPNSKLKETMKGDITVMGNKFKLAMDGHEVINNGTTVWTYMKGDNEVNISDYDPSDEEITPNQIYNMYKKGYKYSFVKEEKQGGQVYEIIELTPEDRSNPVFKVELTINQKDKTLKSWKMFRNNGNRYTYTITKFTPNPEVAAADFTFDKNKYKGVRVIDLR
jgi:outer membrane lipoprotein carrier protein